MFFTIILSCTQPFSPVLIELEDWRFGDLSSDPLIDHQPDSIECAPNSIQIESEQLEVETDLCNYALIDFSLLQDVPKGAMADFLLLHTGLWSEEPATAHAALLINGVIFWETEESIPASAEFFFYEGPFPVEAKEGDLIQLHIHNHGANDWRFGYFRRMQEE